MATSNTSDVISNRNRNREYNASPSAWVLPTPTRRLDEAGPIDHGRANSAAAVAMTSVPAIQPSAARRIWTPPSRSRPKLRYMMTNRNSTMIAPA
jgi:hypothetical protein